MKVLIDIPEDEYQNILHTGKASFVAANAIEAGTPIPDNATNGYIMQTMFPNADIEIHNITVYVLFDTRNNVISFDLDWWNAPYQKGDYV